MLTIYDTANEIRFETPINKGSKRVIELMGANYVTLIFSVDKPIYFQLGDWCDIPGFGKFELVDLYHPTYNKTNGGYDYDLQLEAYYCKWRNKIFKYTPETGGREASWSLTATLDVHLGVFLRNLKALGYTYNEQEFIFSIDSTVTQSAKLLTYNNTDMLSALTMMAEAWECEWWIEDHVIYFGRCELGTPIDFQHGINIEDISSSANKNVYATRIYAFGSTRNIPVNYRPIDESVVVNGIVQKRLMLPAGTPYVDAYPNMPTEAAVEQVVVFDDVYPRTDGTIDSVSTYTDTVPNDDGTTATETFYRFKDSSISFSKDYILENEELHIIFQSGSLNGLDFGVAFNPLGVAEKLPDGSWNPDAQMWEIVANEDYGRKLPDTILKPKAGDKYVLYGWDATKIADLGLIAKAEQELLERTEEYIAKTKIDPNSYPCTMMSDWLLEQGDTPEGFFMPFGLGDKVNLISDAFFVNGNRESRIIGIECPLDFPYDSPIVTIGETPSSSRLSALEDSIESLTLKGETFVGGGNGKSVYLITTNDTTTPTNRNAFSSLRSLKEFLNKTHADRTPYPLSVGGRLKAEDGAHFGDFVQGQFTGRGGAVDAAGNAEFESIVSRSYLKVMELIYNRLNAQEGDTSFSDFGTIEEIFTDGDGNTVATLRKRWDGDFTAFQPGDIIYGYVNNLDKADVKEWYKAWARIVAVDRTANQITVVLYPDSEVPSGINHPMTAGMNITRWGNVIEPSEETYMNPDYSLVIGKRADGTFYNMRQSTFYISTTDGNLVELMGVNKPIRENGNYGTVLGKIPEGLLDPKTEELINKGQPYLYARGILVQDLIHINYKGLPVRTANYRGQWSAQTAASAADYYRVTDSLYDTVTHNGALWQCVVTGSTDEPGDLSPAWVKMTASYDDTRFRIWTVNPSATIISIRADEIKPERLTCTVTMNGTSLPREFDSNIDLYEEGAVLMYSLDGEIWKEFVIGNSEPLSLEDETGLIELEYSTGDDVLIVGGDNINTDEIGDRIYFELRSVETDALLSAVQVPVVKDGARGPFQSIVFIRTNEKPATPAGGTYDSPIPTSTPQWYDGIPDGEEIVWASARVFRDGVSTEWSAPSMMTDTDTYNVEFSDVDENPGNPTDNPDNWHDPDEFGFASSSMLWRAECHKRNGEWSEWTVVRIKGEKGDSGIAGDWTSYAFKESEERPDTPTDTENTIPDGWADAPASLGRWWMTKATIDGTSNKPGEWSEPVQVTAEDGKDGENGQYTDFKYRAYKDNETPLAVANVRYPDGWSDEPPFLEKGYALWMIQAEIDADNKLIGSWSKPTRISGEKGEDGGEISIWTINPSAPTVSVRHNQIIPERLSATVTLNLSLVGAVEFASSIDLYDAGAELYFSIDGEEWRPFVLGVTEPLELEGEEGFIELEDSTDGSLMLTVGGDDINTDTIGDRIYFELRAVNDGAILATTQVPVIRDGEKGENGKAGLMAYPAGNYDPNIRYSAKGDTVPVVMDVNYDEPTESKYFRLKEGTEYRGNDVPEDRNTPSKDVAKDDDDTVWVLVNDFDSVFANIIMANFGKLASAVFYGDWMISQWGTDLNGNNTNAYQNFKDNAFIPNIAINFKDGEGTFRGNIRADGLTLGAQMPQGEQDDWELITGALVIAKAGGKYALPMLAKGCSRVIEILHMRFSPLDGVGFRLCGATDRVYLGTGGEYWKYAEGGDGENSKDYFCDEAGTYRLIGFSYEEDDESVTIWNVNRIDDGATARGVNRVQGGVGPGPSGAGFTDVVGDWTKYN